MHALKPGYSLSFYFHVPLQSVRFLRPSHFPFRFLCHIYIVGQFTIPVNLPTCFRGCGRKPKNPEVTHTVNRRMSTQIQPEVRIELVTLERLVLDRHAALPWSHCSWRGKKTHSCAVQETEVMLRAEGALILSFTRVWFLRFWNNVPVPLLDLRAHIFGITHSKIYNWMFSNIYI